MLALAAALAATAILWVATPRGLAVADANRLNCGMTLPEVERSLGRSADRVETRSTGKRLIGSWKRETAELTEAEWESEGTLIRVRFQDGSAAKIDAEGVTSETLLGCLRSWLGL